MHLTSSEKVVLIVNGIREYRAGTQNDLARRDIDTFLSSLSESYQSAPEMQKHIHSIRELIRSMKQADSEGAINQLEQARAAALSACEPLDEAIAKLES